MNLLNLRSHNAALVLDLLRTAGPAGISRLELAERTGLTPQAVSKITARLRAEGLAVEAGRRASTGGKPRTVLRLVPEAGHAVGLHLDRDELTVVLCDLTGAVVAERRASLGLGAGADAVVEGAAGEVEALIAGVSVLGVGGALHGPLDLWGVLHPAYASSGVGRVSVWGMCWWSCWGVARVGGRPGNQCGRRWGLPWGAPGMAAGRGGRVLRYLIRVRGAGGGW
ncbi:winged helix-turn-helix transcriptional regulator [Streptomyces sp. R35]|uniref:Winged helix-turn-helix transcriptional regulator n=1 Tax=Streptomyces sp. R35 TaxID=3238630 RepID=A0AB39S988_9ACTN